MNKEINNNINELIVKLIHKLLLKGGINLGNEEKKNILSLYGDLQIQKKSNLLNDCVRYHSKLTKENYNHNIDINNSEYVIVNNLNLKNSLDNSKLIACELLQQILNKNIILDGNKPIEFNQLVIQAFVLSNNSIRVENFHTDNSWIIFDSKTKGFQIWYLIENTLDNGNLFIYETNQIKEKPYVILNYDQTNLKAKLYDNNFLRTKPLEYKDYFDEIDIDFNKCKYLNMNNGECLVMTRHQPHATDIRRNENNKLIALTFRVILKNEDGSIDLNPLFAEKMKVENNQKKIGNKLYNVDMFDFF